LPCWPGLTQRNSATSATTSPTPDGASGRPRRRAHRARV